MKKLYKMGFALMVLLSVAMSATAMEYKTMYRQNGMAAYADWSNIKDNVSTDHYMAVTNTDDGTDIYVSICTYDMVNNIVSCKSGYVFTQENVFSIDKKLDSASLSAVDVDLSNWETGSIETVTIQAQWNGSGDVTKGSFKYISKYEDYISKGSSSSVSRGATATGSINNNDLGTSDFAGLAKFKSAYIDMKK